MHVLYNQLTSNLKEKWSQETWKQNHGNFGMEQIIITAQEFSLTLKKEKKMLRTSL